MPTTCWARADRWLPVLLLAPVACNRHSQDAATPPIHVTGVTCAATAGTVTPCVVADASGRSTSIALPVDATIRPQSSAAIKQLGQIGNAIAFEDSYPSQPSGMHQCQAGREKFVRVVFLDGANAIQTFQSKLESCNDNVELALDGVTLDPAAHTLHIHWLTAPKTGQERDAVFHVGANGTVTE